MFGPSRDAEDLFNAALAVVGHTLGPMGVWIGA